MRITQKESSVSDSEFVEGIFNQSEVLLEMLYKLHYPMVLQLILNNSGSEQDAKDIYQEAIIVLCDKIQSGTFVLNSKLKTFIYSVSRRLWLKKLSKDQRSYSGNQNRSIDPLFIMSGNNEDTVAVEDELEMHLQREEHYRAMHIALYKLGEPCKTIIEDFYMHEQSMTAISEKFGYTNPDNAKTQKYKCMMRLKKLFFVEYSKDIK